MKYFINAGISLLLVFAMSGCGDGIDVEELVSEGRALVTMTMKARADRVSAQKLLDQYNLNFDNWTVIAPKFFSGEQRIFDPYDPILESKAVIDGKHLVFYADSHYDYVPVK